MLHVIRMKCCLMGIVITVFASKSDTLFPELSSGVTIDLFP